jgi:hypothetical protein
LIALSFGTQRAQLSHLIGLVCLELYKLASVTQKPLTDFRNSFVNLALPLFSFCEPVSPIKHKSSATQRAIPEGWTLWDTMDLHGDMTFQQLIDMFKTKYNYNIISVSIGQAMAYNAYLPTLKTRASLKLSEVCKKVMGDSYDPKKKYVDLNVVGEFEDDDTIECDLPIVRCFFSQEESSNSESTNATQESTNSTQESTNSTQEGNHEDHHEEDHEDSHENQNRNVVAQTSSVTTALQQTEKKKMKKLTEKDLENKASPAQYHSPTPTKDKNKSNKQAQIKQNIQQPK